MPVDVAGDPADDACCSITGPNTGGKTVALKTAGLLALMAQAGLFVPAADARLPVFRSIFADIGDEQSIAASLSTFSWHITNIAAMDRSLALPALVLLDELGAGTDPLEGGALGVAIIDHFRTRGAIVDLDDALRALKTYAATTAGVTAAAFGFTPDTFEPTYHIQYGSPGRSLALEMAGRLGLNGAIIDNARKNLSEREAQLAEHLAKVDTDLRALEHERRLVKREREALGEADARARVARGSTAAARRDVQAAAQREAGRAAARSAGRNRRGRGRLEEAGSRAGRTGVAQRRDRAVDGRYGPPARRCARRGRRARRQVSQGRRAGAGSRRRGPPRDTCSVGDRVVVGASASKASSSTSTTAKPKWTCAASVSRAHRASCACSAARRRSRSPPPVRVNVQLQPRDGVWSSELLLVGNTVDQAHRRAREVPRREPARRAADVRLIHGYGTGQLKDAVVEYLHKHPLVTQRPRRLAARGRRRGDNRELKD